MEKEIIKTAPTIELAVDKALDELGLKFHEVTVEVLSQPRKKFFGLIKVDAKVKIKYTLPKFLEAKSTLEEIVRKMGLFDLITIEHREASENSVLFNLKGNSETEFLTEDNAEVLDALQYIVNLMINDHEDPYIRVNLDYNDFRKTETDELRELSIRLAESAIERRHNVTMAPMNPYKRRIAHSTIQEMEGVSSASIGKEPRRCVVIRPDNTLD